MGFHLGRLLLSYCLVICVFMIFLCPFELKGSILGSNARVLSRRYTDFTYYDFRNVVFGPGVLVKIAVGNFYDVPIY